MTRYPGQSRIVRLAAAAAVLAVAQLGGMSTASATTADPAEEECAYPADVVTTTKVKLDLAVVKAGQTNTAHVSVMSDEGPVEGTVTFTVAGNASSTVPLVGGKASYTLPTNLVAGGTYEVTAAANVTGCLLPSSGSAYVTVKGGGGGEIAGEEGETPAAVVNRAAPAAPAVAPSSGLLPSVGAEAATGILAVGGVGILAAGLVLLARTRRRTRGTHRAV